MAALIARESPVVLFFVYVVSLAIKLHGREIIMLDYSLTFDHWWYFYERLRGGELAQWNPFSLLGRMAVQWNYLPVSIFSPLLVLSELSLERFHALNVAGTVLVLASIYAAGRIAGYGRYLPLVPVVVLAATGFRYWMSFLHFATFLSVYPLAMAYLLSVVGRGALPRGRQAAAVATLLAVSFLGLRLELMVYAVAFLVLTVLAVSRLGPVPAQERLRTLSLGLATVAVIVAASAWQLAFLVNSALDSHRLAFGVDLARLLDPQFLRWLLLGVAAEPDFVLMLVNLALYGICRGRPSVGGRRLSSLSLGVVLGLELLLVPVLRRVLLAAAPPLRDIVQANFGIFLTGAGTTAIILAALVFLRRDPRPTLARSALFLSVLFAGFHASTYTGHTWPVNNNVHPYFVPLPLTGLLALGAVGLWLKGRGWMVAVLAAYHTLGEVGSLVLFGVFGVPWLAPRAAFAELPFQVIVILETTGVFIAVLKGLVGALAPAVQHWVPRLLQAGCFLAALALVKPALFPQERAMAVELFPFGGQAREIQIPNASLEHWARERDGRQAPANCFLDGAPDGKAEPTSDPEFVADGQVSACLLRGPSGRVLLHCRAPDVNLLKGRYVRFHASLKSTNTRPQGVQIDVQDGVGPIVLKSYLNTGKWERHALVTRVNPRAGGLLFTVNATEFSNGKVCVDDLRLEVTDASPRRIWRYAQDFPFGETDPASIGSPRNDWIREARDAAVAMRSSRGGGERSLQRARVSDAIVAFASDQYYKFMPSYSQTLNTAPVYSSEIPATLKAIFQDPAGAVPNAGRAPHPEMTAVAQASTGYDLQQMGEAWLRSVLVFPHRDPDPLFRELLAEEGGSTPRAFLAGRVVRHSDPAAELAYLSKTLARGGRLTDQITTSDPSFPGDGGSAEGKVAGTLAFRRDAPEHVVLEVEPDRPGYLALLDLWSRGWRARVDGRETPIYRAYAGTRFVAVPAGHHTVEFVYTVPGLVPAAWVSLLSWAMAAGALVISWMRPMREKKPI